MNIIERILTTMPNPAFVFDIDGVLASYEYQSHNHGYSEHIWKNLIRNGDPYLNTRPFKVMQKFVSLHKDDCYTCSRILTESEQKCKEAFIQRHYDIFPCHMFFVHTNEEKLDILYKIQSIRHETNMQNIVMIEDTVKVLDYISDHSEFSTVHVSSFFE